MPPKKNAASGNSKAGGKKLVIVESPSKAKTINKYLGDDFEVFASVGHIKDLPKKEIGLDFENHYEPRYEVIAGKEKVVRDMKKLSKTASEVLIATDPDREGEAIAWHISNEVEKNQTNISRVLFNEITAKAIREAIDERRQIDYNLVRSQQARQAMDKIVGYRISPFLWDTVLRGLSAGRVQSVALRLICEREEEINSFQQKEYWSILADFKTPSQEQFRAKLHKINSKDVVISSEAEAGEIAKKIQSRVYRVQEIKKRKSKRNPPSPFTTSLLQQSASNQLGYGSKKTMRLAQQLYEGIDIGADGAIGLITYMRTDSKRISNDAQQEARKFIGLQYGEKFIPEKPRNYKTSDKAQDAHEAIRPTSVFRTPKDLEHVLTKEQYKLYDLIWRRFLASQMSAAELEQTSIDIIDHEKEFLFRASGRVVLFEGFLKLFGDQKELDYEEQKSTKVDTDADSDTPTSLPKKLNEKDELSLSDLLKNQHFTKPPARYSEASLVKELDNFGIGRPSTYASIISTLLDRRYVELRQKRLHPNELGKDVSKILIANFPELFNVTFTSEMQTDLDKVASGVIQHTCGQAR
jgi:DNA topoisomerase-1